MSSPESPEYGRQQFNTDWQCVEIPLPESDEDLNLYWCEMFNWIYGRGFYNTSIAAAYLSRERISKSHFQENRVRVYEDIIVGGENQPAIINGRLMRISPRSDTRMAYKFSPYVVLTEVDYKINGWPISQHQKQEFIVPILYEDTLKLEYVPPANIAKS